MSKNLHTDIERGIIALNRLIEAYEQNRFFNIEKLPEEILPNEMEKGNNAHLLFLSFISSLGYLRKEELLWTAARDTYEDQDLRYLFEPAQVLTKSLSELERDLKEYNLLLSLNQMKNEHIKFKSVDRRILKENDLALWVNFASVFHQFNDSVEDLFKSFDYDSVKILEAFSNAPYSECFPDYQKERKIIIWLLRIKENAAFPIKNFEKLPMPVNYHIIRASFFSGAIFGTANSIQT
ncbi:MAG: hypothetical protein PHV06_12520, partial [bacterium]|nr:hypothetical protein [bacterium]